MKDVEKFSLFQGGIKNTTPNKELTIKDFIKILTDNKLSNTIDLISKSNGEEKKKLKNSLDYVTFNGVFSKRANNSLVKLSNLFCLDFDGLEDANKIKEQLKKDKYIHLMFISPSKKGLKIIFKTPKETTPEDITLRIITAYDYILNKYDLKGDVATHDLSRACFVSYDKDYYYNSDCDIFKEIKTIEKKELTLSSSPQQTLENNLIPYKDTFFSIILNKNDLWNEIFDMLNNHDINNNGEGSNQIFNKNLSIFISKNKEYLNKSSSFIRSWSNPYVTSERFQYYYNKVNNKILSKQQNQEANHNEVNYNELHKWSKKYNLSLFLELLDNKDNVFMLECSKCLNLIETSHISSLCCSKGECKGFLILKNEKKLVEELETKIKDIKIYDVSHTETQTFIIQIKDKQHYIKKTLTNLNLNILRILTERSFNSDYFKYYNKNKSNSPFNFLNDNGYISSIDDLNFKPINKELYDEENQTYFNEYKESSYLKQFQSIEETITIEKFQKLEPNFYLYLTNLTGNKDKNFEYFNKYLSFKLKNLMVRSRKILIFYGEEQTGKGLFFNHIITKIFNYSIMKTQKKLKNDNFDSSFNNILFFAIDESRHDKELEDFLKSMVTTETMEINLKNQQEKIKKVYFEFMAFSNNPEPLKVGEERGVYFKSKRIKNDRFYIDIVKNIDRSLLTYLSYLKGLEVSHDFILNGLNNEEKLNALDTGKDYKEAFIDLLNSFETIYDFYEYIHKNHFVSNQKEYSSFLHKDYYSPGHEYEKNIELNILYYLFNIYQHSLYNTTSLYNKLGFLPEKININIKKDCVRTRNEDKQVVKFINMDFLNSKIFIPLPPKKKTQSKNLLGVIK